MMKSAFYERLLKLGVTSYREYLQSEHWEAAKARYRTADMPHRCIVCENPHYDLHHRIYSRLGEELPSDLMAFCRSCHERIHKRLDRLYPKLPVSQQVNNTHIVLRSEFGWSNRQIERLYRRYFGGIPGRFKGKGGRKKAHNPQTPRTQEPVYMSGGVMLTASERKRRRARRKYGMVRV